MESSDRLMEMAGVVASFQDELRQIKQHLQEEIVKRQQVEESLRQASNELEKHVKKRTTELSASNAFLLLEIARRKQMESALRASEERFRLLSTSSPIGIFQTNLQGDCLYTNPKWQEIAGLSLEQSQGDGWARAIHPEDRETVFTEWQKCVAEGREFSLEFRFLTPQGKVHWVNAHATALRSDTGKIIGYVGTDEDITNRKQAEEEIHSLRISLESAVEGISRLDTQGRYTSVNHAYANLVGYQPEEMIGMEWAVTVHPEYQEKMIAAYQQMLADGKVEVEAKGVKKDGSSFYKQLVMITAYNQKGEFTGHYCFAKDITERQVALRDRKLAEEKIREQAALLDVTTDAIIVRDLQNRIVYWNKGAEHLYGWQAEEVKDKNINEILYKETLLQLEVPLKTVVESGTWQGELNKVTKYGKNIIVESRWTFVRGDGGQPKFILTVDTDITDKKLIEAKFFRIQRLENLGILASGIAHDLNNILTPILAIAQLLPLTLTNLDERNQHMLEILETNTKRGADLVKQILSFARGVESKRRILQVKHLLLDIEQIVKGTFPKCIEIKRNIPDNLLTVAADATQLHQVFMNLAVNARDAMPNGGTLTISAENLFIDENYTKMNIEATVGNHIAITFADTGTGIYSEIIDKIFDPFFSTKEIGKGTGLGLSTVLGIVKKYGGFIEVSSQVEKGSCFKVYLPASEETTRQITEILELPRGNGELILFVDDETAIADISKTTLETHNYRVLIANNGIEAIALYAQYKNEIRVVVMDIMMPSLDGPTAIRALQKMNPLVKIIAMSGSNQIQEQAQARNIGVQRFLSKPFTTTELLNALQTIIEGLDK
jgi:PAS domain S-box-containing protein